MRSPTLASEQLVGAESCSSRTPTTTSARVRVAGAKSNMVSPPNRNGQHSAEVEERSNLDGAAGHRAGRTRDEPYHFVDVVRLDHREADERCGTGRERLVRRRGSPVPRAYDRRLTNRRDQVAALPDDVVGSQQLLPTLLRQLLPVLGFAVRQTQELHKP